MRRTLVLSALSLALLTACATTAPTSTSPTSAVDIDTQGGAAREDARINAWFERKY